MLMYHPFDHACRLCHTFPSYYHFYNYHLNDNDPITLHQETETEERIVNTRGAPEGKFVFTSHIAGDHSICLKSNYTGGWVSQLGNMTIMHSSTC